MCAVEDNDLDIREMTRAWTAAPEQDEGLLIKAREG